MTAAELFWRQRSLWLGVLVIAMVATVTRVVAVEHMTVFVDEIYWLNDGHEALERIRDPNPPVDAWGPRILRHPGVPIAIAGGLAEGTRNTAADRVTENERIIRLARMGVVWMGILCCVIVALLGARVYGLPTGLIAGAILATSPHHVANSAWLQCDSALTLFSITSVLTWILHQREGGHRWLIASAISAGLAVTSKLPGLVIGVYVVGACWLVYAITATARRREGIRHVLQLSLWIALAMLTLYATWPRMWANPLALIETLQWARSVGESHINYFLGAISGAAPWYYYLVVAPFNLNVLELLGIIGSAVWVAYWWVQYRIVPSRETLLLAAWALTFLLFMSVGGKKLGARYVLPLWPIISLFAARFLVLAAQHLRGKSTSIRPQFVSTLTAVSVLVVVAELVATRGDFHAHANRILGGLPVMERVTLVVGVAERDVARYVDSLEYPLPAYVAGHLLSTQWHARRDFESAPCTGLGSVDGPLVSESYLIVYSHFEKRCPAYSPPALQRLGARELQQFIWSHAILARVYRLPSQSAPQSMPGADR